MLKAMDQGGIENPFLIKAQNGQDRNIAPLLIHYQSFLATLQHETLTHKPLILWSAKSHNAL